MSSGYRALKAQASLVGGHVAWPPHLLGSGVVAQSHSRAEVAEAWGGCLQGSRNLVFPVFEKKKKKSTEFFKD